MADPLTGPKAIESAAIAWVMECERRAGREPVDVRYRGAAGDVESPPRTIEVKASGRTARGADLWLEVRQVDEAERNPEFYIYVVENVAQGDPANFTLRVLGGQHLQRLLSRKRPQKHFEVPWPVADYDSTPLGLSTG